MKTIILKTPEAKEKLFRALFDQFAIKYKTLSTRKKEDIALAKLIDKALSEEGEVSKKKIYDFVKKYGGQGAALTPKETKQLIERSRKSGTISMEKAHKQIRKRLTNTQLHLSQYSQPGES